MNTAATSQGLGPIQIIAVEFESLTGFRGQILDEIDEITSAAAARVLDILVVVKESNGDLVVAEFDDPGIDGWPGADEAIGTMLGELIGFDIEGAATPSQTDELSGAALGVGVEDIRRLGDALAPGSAIGFLLLEHRWAIRLRDSILDAGGRFLVQGFLSPQGVMMVGAELAAVADAIDAIELAEAVEAEAIIRSLEALAVIEIADEVEAAVAARTIRLLAEAGIIERAAINDATDAVISAALLSGVIDNPEGKA